METVASEGAKVTIWWVSLGIGAVVLGVVTLLLTVVRNTAVKILDAASQIWTQGKLVANNTIQIPIFLGTTNRVVEQIKNEAVEILGAAKAIEQHADGCPGCPDCVLSTGE